HKRAPLAQGERGSVASLDTLRKGPPPGGWRQPELPEVIAMLNYRLDPVRSNAAAYLQHLTFKNDKVKSDVRRMKGIPALVSMLDNPNEEVHYAACGALKNISFGKDPDNKIAIKNCDGVLGLVRLLRKTRNHDLIDIITGWTHKDASCVLLIWIHCFFNYLFTFFKNVSSERSEARRKLRECTGLVDSLMYIVQSQIDSKEVDNKLTENCVCLLRNLSYHVHSEIPTADRYEEKLPINQGPAPSSQKAGCFSSRKSKGKRNEQANGDLIEIPVRTSPAKGYELLFQPEVVRMYKSLLKESGNHTVLEASAGAIQNLCAGHWTCGRYIRALMRTEQALPLLCERLQHGNDRVVRAMSGALRNLASFKPRRGARELSEETVVSILSTLHEVLGYSVDAAKKLRESEGIERLVLINKDGNRSDREVRGAGLVLQTVWGYKELRRSLEKDGWKKTDFMVNLNPPSNSDRPNGRYDDSTLPLIDKGCLLVKIKHATEGYLSDSNAFDTELNNGYSTLDQRARRNTLDNTLGPADQDFPQVDAEPKRTRRLHKPA
uniref:Catenin delta 1 n=1 Tax=Fundulus heteroclitus TaxID=8078 RepID=A0A3Q2PHS7_FUNHE